MTIDALSAGSTAKCPVAPLQMPPCEIRRRVSARSIRRSAQPQAVAGPRCCFQSFQPGHGPITHHVAAICPTASVFNPSLAPAIAAVSAAPETAMVRSSMKTVPPPAEIREMDQPRQSNCVASNSHKVVSQVLPQRSGFKLSEHLARFQT